MTTLAEFRDTLLAATTQSLANKDTSLVHARVPLLAALAKLLDPSGTVSAYSAAATQTNATGTTWTALAAGACTQINLRNRTGVSVDFRIASDTTIFTLISGEDITLPCLTNSSEWEIRRTDTSNTQVTVQFFRYTR